MEKSDAKLRRDAEPALEKPVWQPPKITVLEVEKITLDGGGGAAEGGATHS